MSGNPVHVFLDLAVGDVPAGRVVFEMFVDRAPLACENYRGLCTGEYGTFPSGGGDGRLHYRGTTIFRVRPGGFLQGGDIEYDDGRGGHSIFGRRFADELCGRIDAAGLLFSAATRRDANDSQFAVSLAPLPHLDADRVVLGRVVFGLDTLMRVGKVACAGERPLQRIHIVDCGQVGDPKLFITADPLGAEGIARIRQENRRNRLFFEAETEEMPVRAENAAPLPAPTLAAPEPVLREARPQTDLRERLRAAYLVEEPPVEAEAPRRRRIEKRGDALQHELERRVQPKLPSKSSIEGMQIFNDEGFFNAYEKRAARLPLREEDLKCLQTGEQPQLTDEKRAFLARAVQEQHQAKKSFSRRRMHAPAPFAAHVNDRNRAFNERLARFFGEQTRDLRNDIQRSLA